MTRQKLSKEEKQKKYKERKVHIILSQSYSVYLFAVIVAVVLDVIYPISFGNKFFVYIGFVFMLLGTLLAYWAQSSSSKSKREMMEKKCPRNFSAGPYKFSRRPTQLGLTLATLGFGLISESFFVVMAVIFSYFITRFVFLRYQEKILMEIYGDAYCDYKEKVNNIV